MPFSIDPSPSGPPWWGQRLLSAAYWPSKCVTAKLCTPAVTVFTRPSGSSSGPRTRCQRRAPLCVSVMAVSHDGSRLVTRVGAHHVTVAVDRRLSGTVNPRVEAFERLGGRYEVRVLEPSPPAVNSAPWYADDPVARGDVPAGR